MIASQGLFSIITYSVVENTNSEKGKIPGHDERTWHSRADGNVDETREDK